MKKRAKQGQLMTVWLCFEAHRKDGKVWVVRCGNTWKRSKSVHTLIPLFTRYRGCYAKQPRAYLVGEAVKVSGNSQQLVIE